RPHARRARRLQALTLAPRGRRERGGRVIAKMMRLMAVNRRRKMQKRCGALLQKARAAASAGAIVCLAACVSFPPAPHPETAPKIDDARLVSLDGASLGLDVWRAETPRAAILALHGMNDYAHHFEGLGDYLSKKSGISVYAYDQRGFGRSPDFGRWPGEAALKADLRAAIEAIHAENPGAPLFVLGHSMGAAVVMTAAVEGPLDVDGAIIAAPGVWGGSQLPFFYRVALNASASVLPAKMLTGERAKRQSTDNIAILREMQKDPHVIKATRLDAVLGVVRLMGNGYGAADDIGGRILFLYGEKDEIIPLKAMMRTQRRLCGDIEARAYSNGWHLLFRDLDAETVYRDVADWVAAAIETRDAAGPMLRMGPAAIACSGAVQEGQR
ncbi:MAG: alpha/beta fold hydrolase, partial [Parvularculaceae bacterium]